MDDVPARIAAVAVRHGLRIGAGLIATRRGATATVYLLPDAALKVAHPGDDAAEAVRRDAAVASIARAAGARVRPLLAFDDTADVVPAPRVHPRRASGG